MDQQILMFFDQKPEALPLYLAFEERLLEEGRDITRKVQKTQISFYDKHLFACVSFLKVRKASERPDPYLVITFGLGRRLDSARVDAAVEPYSVRWTHHVLIGKAEEIDEELMTWVREAEAFAAGK